MKRAMRPVALAVLALAACGSASVTAPDKACADMAAAIARAAERCGEGYQANYDAFVQRAAKGSCANVVRVRDEATLRATCFKYLETVSCDDLRAARLDPTCAEQLLRAE